MRNLCGLPVLERHELINAPALLGVQPWKAVRPPQALDKYLVSDLYRNQQDEVKRFLPETEVSVYETPNGKPFTGFRRLGGEWVAVFAVMRVDKSYYVPLNVEWFHGVESLCISLPAGCIDRDDVDSDGKLNPLVTALRECLEESGLKLRNPHHLMPGGIALSPRNSTERFHPICGTIGAPDRAELPCLEPTEFLRPFLVTLKTWREAIVTGVRDGNQVLEITGGSLLTSHLALAHMAL